jgi:hypothetical protein
MARPRLARWLRARAAEEGWTRTEAGADLCPEYKGAEATEAGADETGDGVEATDHEA